MKYSIQRLDKNNLVLMRRLNKLFTDVFEDVESYADKIPTDAYVESFIANRDNIVLVATVGEKVVGGLVAYTLTKFERERREIYLYDLAVSREQQRTGIGRKLMEELMTIARAVGAYVVFVQADEGDDAIRFYESLTPSENIHTRNFDYLT
ncbi:MAG: aac3-I [Candidatus Saccharibacteria bacterium]|nr:aac3-I [Candidatus Saccharibacteria bacterium]